MKTLIRLLFGVNFLLLNLAMEVVTWRGVESVDAALTSLMKNWNLFVLASVIGIIAIGLEENYQ